MSSVKVSSPFEFNLIKRDADGNPIGNARVRLVCDNGQDLGRNFNDNGELVERHRKAK